MSTKTTLTPVNEIERDWYVVDAADQRLGRLASEIAQVLRGKKKANYAPNMDVGDFVVVVNAVANNISNIEDRDSDAFSTRTWTTVGQRGLPDNNWILVILWKFNV